MKQFIPRKTAILVDGGYYRKRALHLWGKKESDQRAKELVNYCMMHINEPKDPRDLYRIFYYDCFPMKRTLIHPLTGAQIHFKDGKATKWALAFYDALSSKTKVALRMGELAENTAYYAIKQETLLELLKEERSIKDLTEEDFQLAVTQQGVDMRIGLDAATLSSNRYVNQIILIAGDSDFVPVAKTVRRNGADFILDPMKQSPRKSFLEHVDFVECYVDKMYKK